MATQAKSIAAAGVTVICTLLTLGSALPTNLDRDVSVPVQPTNNASPPAPAAAFPQEAAANLPTTALHARPGSNRAPAAPYGVAPSAGSVAASALGDPFTNHFVLDTANLDLDGDGCIAGEPELDLFKYHVATALAGSPNNMLRAHSIVHRTDTNKDGRICWCDFISIYLHDKDTVNEHHRAAPFVVILDKDSGMFSRLDLDKDGVLKGSELDTLAQQFASCIPEEQARLIVAAMTGLGVKDGAISSQEFARFLGLETDETFPQPVAKDKNKNTPILPSSNDQQPKEQSDISGIILTSTTAPKLAGNTENKMAATTKNQ